MWVVKIGASFLDMGLFKTEGIVKAIKSIKEHEQILVVPGGGLYADAVRRLDHDFKIGNHASHWMAIMGMQLNAYRLALRYPRIFRLMRDLQSVPLDGIPLILPFDVLQGATLPEAWSVTSDSIAAYIAHRFCAKLMLVKDVDGILSRYPGGRVLPSVPVDVLPGLRSSPVDGYLSRLLSTYNIEAWIVNGLHPKRLERVAGGEDIVCTRIQNYRGGQK